MKTYRLSTIARPITHFLKVWVILLGHMLKIPLMICAALVAGASLCRALFWLAELLVAHGYSGLWAPIIVVAGLFLVVSFFLTVKFCAEEKADDA
ncbi:MAG: hypothetical protein ACRER5_04580 [Pseudomonas sp.]